MLLWFTGFISIGGEWFLMWQSTQWNATQAAFRIFVNLSIILVYVSMTDTVNEAKSWQQKHQHLLESSKLSMYHYSCA